MDRRRASLVPARGTEKRMSISNRGRTNSIPLLSKATIEERTALKIAAKKPAAIKIINEQVPAFSSKPPQKFCTIPVQRFLEEYLPDKLRGVSYGPTLAGRLAKEMSEEIKEFAKGALPPRYKLVSIVTLGERRNEVALLTSRALWDSHADTFVSHCYQNGTVFCAASVFAVYCE